MMLAAKKITLLATAFASLATSFVKAEYDNPATLPAKTDEAHGQRGWNDCIKRYGASSSKAHCQNIYLNSIKDFCLYAPANAGKTIGDEEETVVSYCLRSGYGTRLIPAGTISGAHFIKTPSFVQITGVGDLTKINILPGDEGGELDPHGATGAGNPIGGLVFTRAFNLTTFIRIYEWQHFVAYDEFCFRACIGPNAADWCPHIYDLMGCKWNEPGNYNPATFDQCDGTEGEYTGVYNGVRWYQGQKPIPEAHMPGKSYNCRDYPSLPYGKLAKLVPA